MSSIGQKRTAEETAEETKVTNDDGSNNQHHQRYRAGSSIGKPPITNLPDGIVCFSLKNKRNSL